MIENEIITYILSIIDKDYLNQRVKNKEIFGITAKDVSDYFNIYRSTVSTLLNNKVDEGSFIKIQSRPVRFVPKSIVEKEFNIKLEKSNYTFDEIKELFFSFNETIDPFSILIGYDGSQALQVKQAESAILYPPKGLHTLITGESGTGKTLFAHAMYNYGKQMKSDTTKYPFVEFNCADYYYNPQLLLSQLFGHIKGAFTGAEKETTGLVEKANHGILFLDEIHRLPPEGQELLFYLMDTGHYRKMGEANTTRIADILIIGATTEDPNDVLLKTFKRRIPLTIHIPPLRDRPIEERLKIVEHLFSRESSITQRTYIIDANIIKSFILFDFPENIGQLASEIKILCARSFLENKNNTSNEIAVPYKFLSRKIRTFYQKAQKKGYTFTGDLENYNFDLIITPSNEVFHSKEQILNEKSYNTLMDTIKNYSNQGLSSDEVAVQISSTVSSYYNDILNKMYFKNIKKDEIDKIIDPEIVDFSMNIMKEIRNNLNVKISEQNILILAFHLKFLIERLRKIQAKSIKSYPKIGHTMVDDMIDKIENKFSIHLPTDEKSFFQMLIKNITNRDTSDESSKPLLYILAHGNTASSIADVCNRLLNTNFIKSFDMPLTQNVQQSYKLFIQEIESLHPEKGVIILADMGSLLNFGKDLTRDTGIPSHTIPNVSTALALDFAHIMMNRNEHVDITYNEYLIRNRVEVHITNPNKEPVIISTCSSGKGTSIAFKNTIEDLLDKNNLNFIKVFSLNNTELQKNNENFQELFGKYNILAIVGNIRLDLDIPFFHITELINDEKKEMFIQFIKRSKIANKNNNNNSKKSKETIDFLAEHVMYVNPLLAEKVSSKFIDTLFKDLNYQNNDIETIRFSLTLHLGFMIERLIIQTNIIFDDKDIYMKDNQNIFNIIKTDIAEIEDIFQIKVSDDEICYIIVTLYPESYDKHTH